jgi:glutamate---cysteine ligase / carboxylate-amine ligase
MNNESRQLAADAAAYAYPIGLGEAVGMELEYMIVDRETLAVRPLADEVLRAVSGSYTSDAEPEGPEGVIAWSNELVLHVIELKTPRPVPTLLGLTERFQKHVRHVNSLLEPQGARLLPTAMHPWMNPWRETKLWPHEYNPVYEAYDRIFNCKGHGWANLQSTHVNLPFGNDDEFGRLHAAIRLILPLIPALAASSPLLEGSFSACADERLNVYLRNSARVPSVMGRVIPEPVYTRADYEGKLLGQIYRDLQSFDPEKILRHEWVNSRGCIARFDRGSIEIRLTDIQECPRADLAIADLLLAAIEALTNEVWVSYATQRRFDTEALREILLVTMREAEAAEIGDRDYLKVLGLSDATVPAGEVWQQLSQRLIPADAPSRRALDLILTEGTLSTRIRRALPQAPERTAIASTYHALADCLQAGRLFLP